MSERLCRFTSGDELKKKDWKDYAKVKSHFLAVGKFSAFDAYPMDAARALTRLCHDPEIKTTDLGFPWTKVERRSP